MTGCGQGRDLIVAVIGDAKSLCEVVSGSGGYDCQRARGAGCDERVGDTTAGSVTADDGDRRPAFLESRARESLLVAALTRLLDVVDAKRGEGLRDVLQSSPRGAFSCGGVDDQPRGPGQAASTDGSRDPIR